MKTTAIAALVGATLLVSTNGNAVQVRDVTRHIHKMLTVEAHRETKNDCLLPVLVLITCGSIGIPMTSTNGPIQSNPQVYIVRWGWTEDPFGVAAYQENFFNGVGGNPWAGSQTQYCDQTGDPIGLTCPASSTFAGNPANVLKGVWDDTVNTVPNTPTDGQIAAEAIRAAVHFGNLTPDSNTQTQYIIDTPRGKSTNGFNTSWCAYHGMTPSPHGGLAYTNFPYIPDAGGSCGQNFVNPGSEGLLDGVSIVGGHEYSETVTDPDVSTGWFDLFGAENADKCAWIQFGPGAMANISLPTGTFAAQSLWSNNMNLGLGGCSIYYTSATDQH